MFAMLLPALRLSLLEVCRLGFLAGSLPPRQRRTDRSLRSCGAGYIRLLRACLSQFLLKEPMSPKNLLYVSPSSLVSYLARASSMVQR